MTKSLRPAPRQDAIDNRAIKFGAERSSVDTCSFCRTPFPDFTMTYQMMEGSNEAVGTCCIETLQDMKVFTSNLYRRSPLADNDPTPWVYDDFTWFLLHPERSHRVRPAYGMEYPELAIAVDDKVIVRHIEKETFIKVLLNWDFSRHICDDERHLQLIVHIARHFKNDDNLICEDIRPYKISV